MRADLNEILQSLWACIWVHCNILLYVFEYKWQCLKLSFSIKVPGTLVCWSTFFWLDIEMWLNSLRWFHQYTKLSLLSLEWGSWQELSGTVASNCNLQSHHRSLAQALQDYYFWKIKTAATRHKVLRLFHMRIYAHNHQTGTLFIFHRFLFWVKEKERNYLQRS